MAEFNDNPPELTIEEDILSESETSQPSTKVDDLPPVQCTLETYQAEEPTCPLEPVEEKSCQCCTFVSDVILWKNVQLSLVILITSVSVFLAFCWNNFLYAVSNILLAIFLASSTLKIYNDFASTLNYQVYNNFFESCCTNYLDLNEDRIRGNVAVLLSKAVAAIQTFRSVCNFQNPFLTLKYMVSIWMFSYLFRAISLPTLLIWGTVFSMSVPWFFNTYKDSIDRLMGPARPRFFSCISAVCEKVPVPSQLKEYVKSKQE